MAKRQCGTRKKGGAYAEAASGPDGMPLEYFIVDPPIPVDLAELGIAPRGVHMVPRDGIWHIFDCVGADLYPDVPDVIEEGRVMGFSRRCELVDYSRITKDSRIVLLHKRGMDHNYPALVQAMTDEQRHEFECPIETWQSLVDRRLRDPQRIHKIDDLKEMCAGLWYHDLTDVEEVTDETAGKTNDFLQRAGTHIRKLECGGNYYGWTRPEGVEPDYQYAIIMSLPLGRLVVINDPDDNTHQKKLEKLEVARKNGVAVELVDE